ncbi:Potassium-transporting ATPase potassium-binding subunit [Clarias magur]|uniref:Potassium-transporting ATPase potassium-binding subunit n=1 Tax=Clarias magur TaxID=1594786 RepID=A0A8J4ULF9_CLAMG|nr:Potassium-transporting ATPase potassium-binding subunit [Clarias magur]
MTQILESWDGPGQQGCLRSDVRENSQENTWPQHCEEKSTDDVETISPLCPDTKRERDGDHIF